VQIVKIVRWQEDEAWIGYLQDYPHYWTQGKSLEDLKEHLRDLYQDVTRGEISVIRKVYLFRRRLALALLRARGEIAVARKVEELVVP
jgi:predicted RNase H-like HicB family nuclease